LDPTGCATLNISDSYGDGIIAPDGVTLSYDGDVVYDGGDFRYGEVFNFGDACASGSGGDTGGNDDCVTLTMDLLTDDFGSETGFFLVTSEDGEERIWDENDFGDNMSRQFSACLDPAGCATLDIFDWYGDGISAPGGVTLSYDGDVIVYDRGDFGYGEIFHFGDACPSGGDGGGGDTGGNDNCITLTMDLLTDNYGSETEFFLVTSEDGEERIWDGLGFGDKESHQFNACLDPTGCATLNILDSYGDGIFAPDGVTLSYDGDVVYDSGDFGYGEVFNFGDGCASGGGGGDTSGNGTCVTLTMDLMTDDYGSETEFFLVTTSEDDEWIWDEYDFGDNESHQFSACLDRTGCATLDIFDWYGDGIFAPGGVTLSYDGDVVYDHIGDIGYGEVFRFGDGC
jgi:hypothetical protein